MPVRILLFIAVLFPFALSAQTKKVTISFHIANDSGANVSRALIVAKNMGDKQLAGTETNENGKAALTITGQQDFLIEISHVGYILYQKKYSSPPAEITENIALRSNIKALDSITIVSKKPILIIQPDRYVLNIDGKTELGNTTTDIIKKVPGVTVTNNQVFLEGKPVTLQVDGKTMPLSGKELLDYLSSNSALNLNQIELITTPPSTMDASFTGGVINLKIRKLKTAGYNGSFSAGGGMRSRYPFGNLAGNINYRNGKFNFYSSAGWFTEKRVNKNNIHRFTSDGAINTAVTEDLYGIEKSSGLNYTAGVDIYITDKTIAGVMLTGRHGVDKNDLDNKVYISNNNSLDSLQQFLFHASDKDNLNVLNLNFKKIFDSTGKEINIDIDYNFINSKTDGDQYYRYMLPSGTEYKSPYRLIQHTANSPDLYGVKVDYKKPFRTTTMETGIKIARSKIGYTLDESREVVSPPSKTDIHDVFNYDETIYAGYLSFAGKIKKLAYRVGLRGEATSLSGKSFTLSKTFDTSYVNFFPTLSVTQSFDKKNILSLSFRRSIARPRFNQLNPFRYYVSPFYYYTGNPDLRPYFPYSLRLSYSYNNKFQFTTSYSFVKEKIIEVSRLENNSNVIKSTRENIGKTKNLLVSGSYYDNVTSWWYTNNTAYLTVNDVAFTIDAGPVGFTSSTFTFSSSHRFTLPENIAIELYGYYSSGAYYDASYLKPYGYIDIGISKEILDGKGEVAFRVNDLFYSNVTRSVTRYNKVNYTEKNRWDSRIFNLSFYYAFGNSKIQKNRQRNTTANSDERTRAN